MKLYLYCSIRVPLKDASSEVVAEAEGDDDGNNEEDEAASKSKSESSKNPAVLWAELEETQIEVDEFDQLFSRPVVKPKASRKKDKEEESKPKKAAVAKYFDQKKSQVSHEAKLSKFLVVCQIDN